VNERLRTMVGTRRRSQALAGLRTRARAEPGALPIVQVQPGERCDLCGTSVPGDHRHMLDLSERRIVCTCEACWALRSGEARFAPVGSRTLWLEGFSMPDHVWASFRIPIGLAFFLHSSVTDCVVAMYPSPVGATESELHFSDWRALVDLNPILEDLLPDAEALLVNRMADPPQFAIAPIDRAYELVGLIKVHWEGISGGAGVEQAVTDYFARLREAA
jgi:hypothetical protein